MKCRCPICKKIFKTSPQEKLQKAKLFPFCSQRCKLIDLGAWFDAKYKVTSKLQSQKNDEQVNPNFHEK
ncbi:MAG: DNA gyrase inhibitor YacG [Planctomycetota bacterium]